ncbi:hypothetical protein [Streptomyces acidiscabies]|uniref:Peptidase C31 domain-containing protein n=1 Tax=Streptomyces acidiscabies TaxID=42234 RepID=A0AAP6BM90_9ACTN|nr:hypothetical protein [Streptomyces acidiscabies]MBP5936693.1 hypothetical protein [Streptomyces sp. LBUM 1476]MBZ3915310.1 hypothetical protein [Streptomyces acidiscabies]MDX2967391.1 hypothetical protein [Streptomyces acidiscabies]MDX3026163.1 hypothetical protein [Streptomyces acidiscabies]MDX3797108.1 hypothetical protein [Streptomyces acidiscabies]
MKPSHASPEPGQVRRRMLLGTLVLVVLLAVAGTVGYLNRPTSSPSSAPLPSPAAPLSSHPSPSPSATGPASSLLPPTTRDPLAYAKAAAVALWSYDTRARTQSEHLALLHRWLSTEKKVTDAGSVDALVPSPSLWGEMASSLQYATATASDAQYPVAFAKALREEPSRLTTAYVYAVTVTGKQRIAWKGSPKGGAETRSVTLAVQCRPGRACALAGVFPAVAQ